MLTEERSQGEFCDFSDSDNQVGIPGWWALICIAPIQSFSNEKKSSSRNLIRGVETLGAQAIGKKHQVGSFMLSIFTSISLFMSVMREWGLGAY